MDIQKTLKKDEDESCRQRYPNNRQYQQFIEKVALQQIIDVTSSLTQKRHDRRIEVRM